MLLFFIIPNKTKKPLKLQKPENSAESNHYKCESKKHKQETNRRE